MFRKSVGRRTYIAIQILLLTVLLCGFACHADPVSGADQTCSVVLLKEEGTDVRLIDAADSEKVILPDSQDSEAASFIAAPGTYYYETTRDTYYHTRKQITVSPDGYSGTVEEPVKEQYLNGITAKDHNSENAPSNATEYGISPEDFDWETHEYSIEVPDYKTAIYAWIDRKEDTSVTRLSYIRQNGQTSAEKTEAAGTGLVKVVCPGLAAMDDRAGSVTFRIAKEDGDCTWYQDYILHTVRTPHIGDLALFCDETGALDLYNADGSAKQPFGRSEYAYRVSVPQGVSVMDLTVTSIGDSSSEGSQTIAVNGEPYHVDLPGRVTAAVPLDPEKNTEELVLTVNDEVAPNIKNTYRITVVKSPSVFVSFHTVPDDTVIVLRAEESGSRIFPDQEGRYLLSKGSAYIWSAGMYGYTSESGQFNAEQDDTIQVNLAKSKENESIDPTITAEWPNYRIGSTNSNNVNYPLPIRSEDTVLHFASKAGEASVEGACGCPILADGALYTYSGDKVLRMNKETGEVEKTGEMAGTSDFAITPPTFAEGMLFVGLSDGRIQAFNAKTLESLWIYQNDNGGQPNCPITYRSGYIYTGFWNGTGADADFVCLSVTDEDPGQSMEEKKEIWAYTGDGFYWAGACAAETSGGTYILVGSDEDRKTSKSQMLSFDARTGKVVDSVDTFEGNIRCTTTYDQETDRYYFSTQGGIFCSVKVDEDGTLPRSSVKTLKLDNGTDAPAMSTSTPAIYHGRAYIGVCGKSQFSPYGGHHIAVIDLAENEVAYTVATKGYPQASPVLTTAYENNEGCVYLYFIENYTPGTVRILKDRPGQTEPMLTTTEVDTDGTEITTAEALFVPGGAQSQYAICSPIADEEGCLYFKNDSSYIMKIGPPKGQGGDDPDDTAVTVTFTLSNDSDYVIGNDADATPLVRVPMEIEYEDLKHYGLEKFYRYEAASFEDGGDYINKVIVKKPTLLMLYLKALGKYYLGRDLTAEDIGGDTLTLTGSGSSAYMSSFWGHDENLMYFVNHEFPLKKEGIGSTADYIILQDGDTIDVAMFTDWQFHTKGLFAAFDNDEMTVKTGERFKLSLYGVKTVSDSYTVSLPDELIRISRDRGKTWDNSDGFVTDENGEVTLSFSKPGVYYVSAGPQFHYEETVGAKNRCIAPPAAVITVTGDGSSGKDPDEGKEDPGKAKDPSSSGSKSNAALKKAKAAKTKIRAKALKKGRAKITWKKVKGVTGYKVYRATKKKGKYKLIKTIKRAKALKYTDKKLKKGKKYYYKVIPYTKIKGKAIAGKSSNIVSVKARK